LVAAPVSITALIFVLVIITSHLAAIVFSFFSILFIVFSPECSQFSS